MRYWTSKPHAKSIPVGVGIATYLLGPDRDHREALLESLLASLHAQTHPRWTAIIVHDGPVDARARAFLNAQESLRVTSLVVPEHRGQFGHPHRQLAVKTLAPMTAWIGLTNDDNQYVPTYLEWLVATGEQRKADFVYCDCVHSHQAWKPMTTRAKRGHLDLGGFLVRSSLAVSVPFDNYTFAGDGDWINRLVAAATRVEKVSATLFIHN